jgi:hypothetical protein
MLSVAGIPAPGTHWPSPRLAPVATELDSTEYISLLHSQLQVISPERYTGNLKTAVLGSFSGDALLQFLKYTAYLSSNNLLSKANTDGFLRWVIDNNQQSMLELFFSVKISTIEAFAQHVSQVQ